MINIDISALFQIFVSLQFSKNDENLKFVFIDFVKYTNLTQFKILNTYLFFTD